MGNFHVDEFGRMGALGSTSATSAIVFPVSVPAPAPQAAPQQGLLLPPKSAPAPRRPMALGRVKPRVSVAFVPSGSAVAAKPRSGAVAVLVQQQKENDAKWAKPSPFGGSAGGDSISVASSGSSSAPAYVPSYAGPATSPTSSGGSGAPYVGGSPLDAYSPSYGPASSPLSVPDESTSPGGSSSASQLVQAPSVAGGAPPPPDATGYYIAGGVLALAAGLGLYMALR
jgi:hypothetical protein